MFKKNENLLAILGIIISIITFIITSILSWNISKLNGKIEKNNEIESRIFEIKKETYENFLEKYYSSFNNLKFKKIYEETYENLVAFNLHGICSAGRSDIVWNSIINTEKGNKIPEKIIGSCYYDYPYRCNAGTCFGVDYKNIPGLSIPQEIGEAQNDAVKKTISDLLFDFKKETYKYQLLLPKDMYSEIIKHIEEKLFIGYSTYRDCNGSNTPECGYDFDYLDVNGKTDILIDTGIIILLRDDLQKHYKF